MQQGGWNQRPNQGQGQMGQPGQQNQPMRPANQNQGGNQKGANFDFNRISEMPSKYPREEIP